MRALGAMRVGVLRVHFSLAVGVAGTEIAGGVGRFARAGSTDYTPAGSANKLYVHISHDSELPHMISHDLVCSLVRQLYICVL